MKIKPVNSPTNPIPLHQWQLPLAFLYSGVERSLQLIIDLFNQLEKEMAIRFTKLSGQIANNTTKIEALDKRLTESISGLDKKLTESISGLERNLDKRVSNQ